MEMNMRKNIETEKANIIERTVDFPAEIKQVLGILSLFCSTQQFITIKDSIIKLCEVYLIFIRNKSIL